MITKFPRVKSTATWLILPALLLFLFGGSARFALCFCVVDCQTPDSATCCGREMPWNNHAPNPAQDEGSRRHDSSSDGPCSCTLLPPPMAKSDSVYSSINLKAHSHSLENISNTFSLIFPSIKGPSVDKSLLTSFIETIPRRGTLSTVILLI